MEKIRFGIIGVGEMGSRFAAIVANDPQCELAALADIDEEKVEKYSSKYCCPGYTDYNNISGSPEIDAVIIATPEQQHLDPILSSIEHKKHILVEKPLVSKVSEAQLILKKLRGYKQVFTVGHILRFGPQFIRAYQAIRNGEIGDVIHMYARRNVYFKTGRLLAERTTPIFYTGIHDIDILSWINGCPVEKVVAKSTNKVFSSLEIDCYDVVYVILEFTNRAVAVIETSFVLPEIQGSKKSPFIEIVGTKGVIFLSPYKTGIEIGLSKKRDEGQIIPYFYESYGITMGSQKSEISQFVRAIKYNEPPVVTAREAYQAVVVAEAVEKSLVSNQEIVCQY